jgi:carbon-monoxide dehydrogenase large subunit
VRGTDLAISLADLPARMKALGSLPAHLPQSLDSSGEFTVNDLHFPNGCHVAEVEIDRETGRVSVDRYCAVDDVGTVINPHIVHGQIHGGVAQGLGQALFERCVYDDDGQLVTGSFMDYAMPRAADIPAFVVDFHQVPATTNPLGVKGCGEIGVTGSIAAISNAVADALARMGVTASVTCR